MHTLRTILHRCMRRGVVTKKKCPGLSKYCEMRKSIQQRHSNNQSNTQSKSKSKDLIALPKNHTSSNVVMGKPTHDDVYDRQIRLWGADAQVRRTLFVPKSSCRVSLSSCGTSLDISMSLVETF